MPKIQNLKSMTGTKIIESKLSNMAKKQLLIFLKEEKDEHVLKSFILDGKIISGLDEQVKEIIDDRFLASEAGGRIAALRKSFMSMSSLGIAWPIYRKIRSVFDVCTKKCGKYELNTVRRQYCMTTCNLAKYKQYLVHVSNINCSEQKNPIKCKDKKQKNILKYKVKISKLEKIINKQEIAAKKRGTTPN